MERFYGTLQSKLHHFDSVASFIQWYNSVRYHMSLEFNGFYETPDEAFQRKLPPEQLLGSALEVFHNS
ncbi:MAG TPA: hypothetical protein ENL31_00710 [Candidatus Aciduliprofundum boonei]|uniref:Uncharacterized protein n=1 Tax=Candidatus Aciduliprofundum boonei TaxID=379547 RepID=A0A7J3T9M3_9ARCH|nr:hypothetical protein [Candidatus Aciduliprofundum boonei]